jgi:GH25 family lysozyme M1 (1,4-beta-N-acetylmuramidase)
VLERDIVHRDVKPANSDLPSPAIGLGDRGPAVERWQKIAGATADGVFGPLTERMTKVWQKARGLLADGIVGPKTWAEAMRDSSAPSSPIITGIDISQHQPPARFDWKRIAQDHRFVIARACYGSRPDSAFVEHVRGAKRAGLKVGAYVFFRQHEPWESQLAALESACRAAGLGAGDIVPTIDLEANPQFDGPMERALHNGPGRALVEAVAKRWGAAIVYLAPGHWLDMGRPNWVSDHYVWTAHWGVHAPSWPVDWALWQTTATHRHAGFFEGKVDLDMNRARRLPISSRPQRTP